MDLEEYRKRFNKYSAFLRFIGAQITVLKEGYAEAELTVKPELLNMAGIVHGGVIFSLGDSTVGAASKSYGHGSVTLEGKMNYIHPISGVGSKVKAVAQSIHAGRQTGVYECRVYDGEGNLAAIGQYTMFMFPDRAAE